MAVAVGIIGEDMVEILSGVQEGQAIALSALTSVAVK